MATRYERHVDNGDGTIDVYGITDANRHCHIHIPLDMLGTPDMATLLEHAGAKIDGKAQSLATQEQLDNTEGE